MRSAIFCFMISITLCCFTPAHAYTFTYHWEIDETPSGQETVHIPQPIAVKIEGLNINVSHESGAAVKLATLYKVYLSPQWDSEKASLLLDAINNLPGAHWYFDDKPSYWLLSTAHIHNDIIFGTEVKGVQFVTIASEAFNYAGQLMAKIDGVRGRFFSKRLHRAVIRFATDNGSNRHVINTIMRERYGISLDVPDYAELTKHTTGEHAGRFEAFKPEEIIALMSMLEEYPTGMLSTPGLRYMLRRLGGSPHPLYPQAAAVAWPSAGYIEFMESAFKGGITKHTQRLILHEKAHFLWEHLFDEQLKQDWIELGGWFRNPDVHSGWSTTKQVEFVSAYAHGENPNEDMAESISYYIVSPNKLRSRSPAKYAFIQNRVMHGTRYISKIREDLTFEVHNLYPDYVYPGKIVRIDISVVGEPEADKRVTIEIQTHTENDLDTAKSLYVRSFNGDHFFDVRLTAIDASGTPVHKGYIFRGTTTLSKHRKQGYYTPRQISFEDDNGNERHQSENDFGWQLYLDNPLEDLRPPEYVPNSAKLSLSQAVTGKGEPYQIITATWLAKDDLGIAGYLAATLNDTFIGTYSRFWYADVVSWDGEVAALKVDFKMPHYMPGGEYKLNGVWITDVADNGIHVYFTDEPDANRHDTYIHLDEPPAKITIKTKNPDFEPPVLDVNRITVDAKPTLPEAPNGETIVTIAFFIKDNISGYEIGSMRLRDPNGVTHHYYHYIPGRGGMFFDGDPTIYKRYTQKITLPVGSIPGIWGLAEMHLEDKAGNTASHDFTEIVRFEVGDDLAAPTLLATRPESTQLLANFPNPFNPETWIPYRLSESSHVTIRILDTTGALVRSLNLGFQGPGFYESRSRAAYWDGRNTLGESVASGVYFYHLQTENLSDVKKMVIVR